MPSPSAPMPDFRALFESAPGLYLVLTADLTIVAVSDAYLRATMTRREQILGRRLFDVFPDNPEDPDATGVANLRASLGRVLEHGKPDAMAVQKYDIRRPEAEGGGFEERHWSPVNSPVLGPDGRVLYVIHRVEDVTEYVRLEASRSEQHRLTEELEHRAMRMESEIIHRAQEIQEANRQLRQLQGALEDRVRERTAELQRANQELKREISERRRTEEALGRSEAQLRQSQKLEAVGLLAGGIAHDFNNLLTVILSYSEVLLNGLAPGDPMRSELAEIHRAGARASELTRQLLAFSRQQVLDPTNLDLNEILRGLNTMLARLLGEDVELRMSLDPQLGPVRADRGQIEQVVMNLAINARDAMPRGGTLTIETFNVAFDELRSLSHLGLAPGDYVLLAVSDTGVGMDAATQSRVFEPFFTTKERGKGTGLGLSTVLGIVQQTGGNLWLYSEPGTGTTFKIYLPRVRAAAPAQRPRATEAASRGVETILLVEDQDQVRGVASAILRKAGYRVLEAASPTEALRLAEDHAGPIDLLLTDVVMPKMNGRQLAERILATRQDTRVLLMSGYTDDVILHHGVLDSGIAFIQKPLLPVALRAKVRETLDAPPGAGRSSDQPASGSKGPPLP